MMLLFRRWLFRTVGLWLARRGYRWWQERQAREGGPSDAAGRRPGGAEVTRGRRRGRIAP